MVPEKNLHGYPDSPVLTTKGWKYLSQVKAGEKLMTLAPDGKTLTYTDVISCEELIGNTEVLAFKNQNLALYIVPDQLIYVRKGSNCETCLVRADDLHQRDFFPMTGHKWHGDDTPYFILPATERRINRNHTELLPEKKIDMKVWLEFFGFWLADGCTTTQGRVKLTQGKGNKEYVVDLLDRLGFRYNIEANTDKANNYVLRNKQLYDYLSQFGKSEDKYIPQEFLMLDCTYLERLYHGYIMGDSHKEKESIALGSVSPKLIDNLQELLLKCKGTLVKFHENKKSGRKSLYRGQFRENGEQERIRFCKPEKTEFHGPRYSVSLQTADPILVKYDERIMWVANQQYTSNAASL